MAKKGGAPENLDPVRTKEEAKKRGRNGGIKSGETRRAQRDLKSTARYFAQLRAKGNLEENLKRLGVPVNERTNMAALIVSVYSRAMSGDLEALKLFVKYMGYDSTEERLDRESYARIDAMANGGLTSIQHSDFDGMNKEERNDVVIMLPDDFRNMLDADEESKGGVTDASDSPETTERSAN